MPDFDIRVDGRDATVFADSFDDLPDAVARFRQIHQQPPPNLFGGQTGLEAGIQQQEQPNPLMAATSRVLEKGIARPAFDFFNEAALGIPGATLEAKGINVPEPETIPEKILSGASRGAGFALGGPLLAGKAGVKLLGRGATKLFGKKLAEKTVANALIKGAAKTGTQLAIAGALQTDSNEFADLSESGFSKEEFVSILKKRSAKGAVSGLIGMVIGAAGAGTNMIKIFDKNSKTLADKVIDKYFGVQKKLSTWYGKQLDRAIKLAPNQKVVATNAIEEIKNLSEFNPRIRSAVSRSKVLKNLLDNKPILVDQSGRALSNVSPENITLKESQQIINDLSKVLSTKVRNFTAKAVTTEEAEIKAIIEMMKAKQVESFSKLAITKKGYAKVKESMNIIGQYMGEPANVITGIEGKLSKNPVARLAMKRIFTPQLIKEIGGWKQMNMMLKTFPKLLNFTGRTLLAFQLGKAAFKASKDEPDTIEGDF